MIAIQIHTDEGIRSGVLVTEGRKYLSFCWPDSAGIRVHKMPKSTRYTELQKNGKPYPVNRAKRMLKSMGRKFGITKAARRALA